MAGACTEFEGEAGVDGVVIAVADSTADRNHNVFVRTIVCTESGSVFTAVVTIACGEVPFSIRVEIKRMESGESGNASDTFLAVAVYAIDFAGELAISSLEGFNDFFISIFTFCCFCLNSRGVIRDLTL